MKKTEPKDKLKKAKEKFIDKLCAYLEIWVGCTTYNEIRKDINNLIRLAKEEGRKK